jgi:glucuronokinase
VIIRETCYARSGLIGNPSDIFNGKVISFLFDAFKAEVTLYETPRLSVVPNARDMTRFDSLDDLVRYRRTYGYYGGIRIIEAILVRFKSYCDEAGISLPARNFTIEYTSDIPFGLGLGGSSTIIKAVFAALMRLYELTERDIPRPVQPNIILEAETVELGISAGPQDRVVAVYGGLVHMDFTTQAWAANGGRHGSYRNLDPSLLPPLFIVYKDELSKSSGEVHNIMRYRASVEHDTRVIEAMARKAELVDEAVACLERGERDELGALLDRDFDLRRSVYTLSPQNVRMVEIARAHGSHANFTGSGGAVVGTWNDEAQYRELQEAYSAEGYKITPVHVAGVPARSS